ncbi:MAG: hypothetical protein CM15mP46_2050 [Alphaproteobacteria bacterium]|nr:MAG: hypothetical protein CM15mP46_2050 [Alphaproteobacteria bacterium]
MAASLARIGPVYHLWLSEIMLQQTIVKTVIPYFLEFTGRWPTIEALAAAPVDEVLAAWAGLGYYARARNLHKTAKLLRRNMAAFSGRSKGASWLAGIGPYTASAIMVMGYGQPGVVVDGNIERVMSRFLQSKRRFQSKREIAAAYEQCRPTARPSDFPQALMDFANAVCTPKAPACASARWPTPVAVMQMIWPNNCHLRPQKQKQCAVVWRLSPSTKMVRRFWNGGQIRAAWRDGGVSVSWLDTNRLVGLLMFKPQTMLRHFPQLAQLPTGSSYIYAFSLEMTIYYAETDRHN